MGLQLEIPPGWNYEEPERVLSVILTPWRGQDKENVSLSIWSNFNNDLTLEEALQNELNRLIARWSIDEVVILQTVEHSKLNNLDIVKITIEAPMDTENQENIDRLSTFQPMEIFVLDADDRFIQIIFRQSTINSDLNKAGQAIIDSIQTYPACSFCTEP